MSPEHLARVFERFFRADPSGNIPGTGLGMTLVKEIVSLHQGEVQVFSELGQGTRVRMALPVPVAPESRGVVIETQVSSH
jgi:signal transduction histidine kinase